VLLRGRARAWAVAFRDVTAKRHRAATPPPRALADATWPEVERGAADRVLAVPVGSTEQHGPHLPLSTDTDVAVALVEALTRRRPETVAAPAIPYGSSGEHAGFPGTLSIGREATELLLVELGRSAFATFAGVVLVCAHGGNRAPVTRAEQRLREEGREVRAFFPRWPGDAHAGRLETSLMLALHPRRLRPALAEPGATAPLGELMPRLVARGVREVSANGILGDPAGAGADEGRRLLDQGTDQLVRTVDELLASLRASAARPA
jgi:mycofactocin precursor peptide peptidase